MIGLDTNILLRFFAQDNVLQSPKAGKLIASLSSTDQGWIGIAALVEFVWVLRSRKLAGREAISIALNRLLQTEGIVVESHPVVEKATEMYRTTRADFADCLIAASACAAGCVRVVTFDRVAARDAGMELLA